MMSENIRKDLNELEDLANRFIIDYKPLSRYQKILVDIKKKIDEELDKQTRDRTRLLRLRDVIVKRIGEAKNEK